MAIEKARDLNEMAGFIDPWAAATARPGRGPAYMRAIIASPKAEQLTSCAPSIRRAKS